MKLKMVNNSTKNFISKVNQIHNNKYNYKKTIYTKANCKVIIICKTHGDFNQRASAHISGQGCPKCANLIKNESKTSNKNEFINKANIIHNNKYDYSLVEYINAKTKIKIICEKHGEFEQIPKNHIQESGCPNCSKNIKYDTKSFIKIANKIHNNKYNYTKTIYVNKRTKVKITCLFHGIFEQEAGSHIRKNGSGCPYCKESKGELKIKTILEKNNIIFIRQKTFDDCKLIKKLPFDFYLPDYNTCVEYDGEQHFKSIPIFGGDKRLIKQQFTDNTKNLYCKINNINLFRISYLDNIEEIMVKIFTT